MRIDETAHITHHAGFRMKRWLFFGEEEKHPPKYVFSVGRGKNNFEFEWPEETYKLIEAEQQYTPQCILTLGNKSWWWYQGVFYQHPADEEDPEVILGVLLQRKDREEKRRIKAKKIGEEYRKYRIT